MRLLLDTCTFLWIAWGSAKLSQNARTLFSDPDNEVFLSAVSTWEIALKYALGKLVLPDEPQRLVPALRSAHGIEPLALDEESHALAGAPSRSVRSHARLSGGDRWAHGGDA